MLKLFHQRMCCLFAKRIGCPAKGVVLSQRTALCKPIIHHAYRDYISSSNEFGVIGNGFLLRNKHSIPASSDEVNLKWHMNNFQDEIRWKHIHRYIDSVYKTRYTSDRNKKYLISLMKKIETHHKADYQVFFSEMRSIGIERLLVVYGRYKIQLPNDMADSLLDRLDELKGNKKFHIALLEGLYHLQVQSNEHKNRVLALNRWHYENFEGVIDGRTIALVLTLYEQHHLRQPNDMIDSLLVKLENIGIEIMDKHTLSNLFWLLVIQDGATEQKVRLLELLNWHVDGIKKTHGY